MTIRRVQNFIVMCIIDEAGKNESDGEESADIESA